VKRSRSISSSHAASLPAQTVVYAVGDIHGRLDLLQGAIGEIERAAATAKSGAKVTAVFLGDYIDRGPAARGVIDRLIAFRDAKPCEIVFLRGNHEQFLLDMIDGRAEGTTWLDYGGVETLASYGVAWPPPIGPRDVKRLGEKLREALPPAHLHFLRETGLHVERGDYVFVHAGLRPERLLSEQSDADMLWFRYYNDDEPMHGMTVVHGHTPRSRPVAGRWRIGIDTEAYDSGALTVARFEGDYANFLKVEVASGEEQTRVSEWEMIDRPHDRQEQPGPAPRSKRTETVSRGGLMAAGAVAVAAIMVVGILVGLVVWFKGRSESDSPPVRPVVAAPAPAAANAAAAPPGLVVQTATPPAPSAAAPTPPAAAKPVTLAAKAPSGHSPAEPAAGGGPSTPPDATATPTPSPPPSASSTTAAAADAAPIRTAPAPETAPATTTAPSPGPAN
jgi:serine/threonine protein phosphatase 1